MEEEGLCSTGKRVGGVYRRCERVVLSYYRCGRWDL